LEGHLFAEIKLDVRAEAENAAVKADGFAITGITGGLLLGLVKLYITLRRA
jgi:hypothetical protein